jgi:predicted lipoprotein with Yx(FWY)xxD motif
MADTSRQAQPGSSSPRARERGSRGLRRGAAFSVIAAAAVLVAACSSAGGSTAGKSTAAGSTASSGYGGTSGGSGTGGNGGGSGSAVAASAMVSARQLSGIGKVLVNGSGRTIYSVRTPSEKNGHIKCTGACTSFWFPVPASSASRTGSGLPGKVGTVHRPGGTTQLTYDGAPLYTFRLDTGPGQAHGNNYTDHFNGISFTWQAETTSGKPTAGGGSAPAPAPSSSSGSSSGGYGY